MLDDDGAKGEGDVFLGYGVDDEYFATLHHRYEVLASWLQETGATGPPLQGLRPSHIALLGACCSAVI